MNKYYDNIEHCPLSVFKGVINENDYKFIQISGEYIETEAEKSWLHLYDQYTDALKSKSNNMIFALKKQLYILSAEYQIINNCLFAIQEFYNCNLINFEDKFDLTYFIKTINDYNYRFDDSKNIGDEIIRVKKQLNNKLNQINRLQKDLEKYQQQGGSFTDTIAAVEVFIKFQIDENKTTVKKFVSYYNQMISANERAKKNGK
jgi:hypothetical protein